MEKAWWWGRQWHQETHQQSKKSLQKYEQCTEVVHVYHIRNKLCWNCGLSTFLALNAEGWPRVTSSKCPQFTRKISRESYRFILDHLQPRTASPLLPRKHRNQSSCAGNGDGQHITGEHHPTSPPLGTTGKTQAKTTNEHLASDCPGRAEDPPKINHSEAVPGQAGVEKIRRHPTCYKGTKALMMKTHDKHRRKCVWILLAVHSITVTDINCGHN